MQSKLAFILNNIFKYLAIFCISFIWCNYNYPNFFACVIASVLIASIICFVHSKIFYVKQTKKEKSAHEKSKMEQTIHQLLFMSNNETIDYFYLVFQKNNYNVTKQQTTLKLDNNIIVPYFNFEMTTNEFLSIFKTNKVDDCKLIILTNKISSELNSFLTNFDLSNIKFVCYNDVYTKLIQTSGIIPKTTIKATEVKKLTILKVCQYAFNKKNTKSYFLSGVLVMFSSLFYKYGLYYQIVGTMLFALSLYSHFNTRFNQPPSTNIFE